MTLSTLVPEPPGPRDFNPVGPEVSDLTVEKRFVIPLCTGERPKRTESSLGSQKQGVERKATET